MSKEKYTDEQLAFEVRRALLFDDPVPDADEAFVQFCERNDLAASEADSSEAVPHRRRLLSVWLTGAVAAAAVVIAFVFILPRLP